MKRILVIACLLLAAGTAAAQNFSEKVNQGRAAYDRGDYTAAVTAYQDILTQGRESAALYYNLGNAELKAGHLGRAIAGYRRALRLEPQDEDIRFNLNYARGYVRQPADRTGFLARAVGRALAWFPGETLAVAALSLYWILAVLAGALILTRGRHRALRWSAAGAGLLFLLCAGWTSAYILVERGQHWGVIVAAQAEARNGPSAEYQVGFTVPEGREVRVLGREGDWVAVGLPSEGYKGWVKNSELIEDE
jgi:tetratricopeptide (TPR) repeat protein